MDDISAGEVGGVFAGVVALLGLVGGGIRWLFGWGERRQDLREKKLQAWEDQLRQRDQQYHDSVNQRLAATEKKLDVVSAALFATLSEVMLMDPASPILTRAKVALQRAYPPPEEMPEDIAALVRRLGLVAGDEEERGHA